MNLYQKGLLAFALVILIAIATVAILVGQRTTTAFRRYTVLYSNRAQILADGLADYYATHSTWTELQADLSALPGMHSAGAGPGAGRGRGATTTATWDFRVADEQGNIVANSLGMPEGHLSRTELRQALPIQVGDRLVGYLLPASEAVHVTTLDEPAQHFLARVWQALFLGGLVALLAAMILAGLLTHGIVAPVHTLTEAAQVIASGHLEVQAPVQGHDEIARLAHAFNRMATSLKRAEEARRAQTADIAHELRNPLAVLQGTLEALADGIYTPTGDNIQPALDQVQTLNRLVGDLRILAQADAGELQLERQPLDLAILLRRVSDIYREPLTEKGIALHQDIPTHLPNVLADYERLHQVLGNILSNALRYVPSGAMLRIVAQAETEGVVVRVIDNGPGVPQQDIPQLFERFWRGEPSRSRATGGSGLGLAIAQRIIAAHNGRIWAESTTGGGLTVAFWLPRG
jgi:signal transduction histidine kinase